jgi:two-component system, LuxR family, response regulator FixJ
MRFLPSDHFIKGPQMASPVTMPLISIVDDDEAVRDSIDAYLTIKGMQVRTFRTGFELLENRALVSDLYILDINMPDIDGFLLLEHLRAQGLKNPVIFITGLGDRALRLKASLAGAAAFLDKPIDTQLLLATILQLLH